MVGGDAVGKLWDSMPEDITGGHRMAQSKSDFSEAAASLDAHPYKRSHPHGCILGCSHSDIIPGG